MRRPAPIGTVFPSAGIMVEILLLPFGAPSLPTSVSTQAIFFPSGEIAVCSKRRVAKSVFITSSTGVEGAAAACFLGFFSCADRCSEPAMERVRTTATNHFENRMLTSLSKQVVRGNDKLTRARAQGLL